MTTVILVIHMMIAATLIGVVLLQRSEGGALGIGGGGGGGFLTGRGTANLLTRATAILAAGFFTTSLTLTILARHSAPPASVFERPADAKPATETAPAAPAAPEAPAPRGGLLDKLQGK
jgi:preprotein translocase subunit SecG